MLKAAQAYFQTQVTTTSQGELLIMLYDGAIKFLNQAKIKIGEKDYAGKGILISRAMDVVSELDSSLNNQKGGELAENLHKLYFYCNTRMLKANLEMDTEYLDEVIKILGGLRSAWVEIIRGQPAADQPEAGSTETVSPAAQPAQSSQTAQPAQPAQPMTQPRQQAPQPQQPTQPQPAAAQRPAPAAPAPQQPAATGAGLATGMGNLLPSNMQPNRGTQPRPMGQPAQQQPAAQPTPPAQPAQAAPVQQQAKPAPAAAQEQEQNDEALTPPIPQVRPGQNRLLAGSNVYRKMAGQ